ncbi:cytochrome P450 [Pyrrhoderma noxium]|uniref:Cytochrome P450 n=1 Tax=Pyrrhoderma noxium TaxID=2282107 RepID=A0A286UI15_9AGAM|nr:cytochrome P450 [Pyrrhoderma noxium]
MQTWGIHYLALPALSYEESIIFVVTCAFLTHALYNRYEFDSVKVLPHLLLLFVLPLLPVYRLSPLHPLSSYPGPVLARVSKIWGALHASKGKDHLLFKRMHDKYGPYVRTGPNELSVLDVEVIPEILGTNGMPRGPQWDGRRKPGSTPSLISTRSTREHAVRRKPWTRAFSPASVKEYEPFVQRRALQLAGELEKRSELGPIDLTEWFNYFAFDIMGDMALGGGFELMRDGGDNEGIWTILHTGLEKMAILQHMPWLSRILFQFSFGTESATRMTEFCQEQARKRATRGSTRKDLFYHLLDEGGVEKVKPPFRYVMSDSMLALVAGSDTTSITLGGVFFYMLKNPGLYDRLRREVDSTFPLGEGEPFDSQKLANMPFLNSVIFESLRLQPPVGSSLQRAPEPGSGGKIVAGRFLPEGTAIKIPPYALFRDLRYFSPAPESFLPDRWLLPTEDVQESETNVNFSTDVRAFIPFSVGPGSCAGKPLAILELRIVIATLMQKFEMQFAEGYDISEWEEAKEDWFAMKNGRLPVTIRLRRLRKPEAGP